MSSLQPKLKRKSRSMHRTRYIHPSPSAWPFPHIQSPSNRLHVSIIIFRFHFQSHTYTRHFLCSQQWCTWGFPPGQYARIPHTPDLGQYNKYGGLAVVADRLAHVDGSIDPWLDICYHSTQAPDRYSTDLRPELLISGAGHHWDSSGIKNIPAEPQFIRNAHLWEIRTVKKWLRGFVSPFPCHGFRPFCE